MFLANETNLTLVLGIAAGVAGLFAVLFFFLWGRATMSRGQLAQKLNQLERGADHTERRMFTILNSIPVALVETDTAGRFVFANKAAHALLGRKDAELIGLRFHSATWGITYPDGKLIPPDLLPAARALRGQTVKGFQHLIVNPASRKKFLVSVTAMPVTNDLGEIIGSTAAMVETEELSMAPAEAPTPWVLLSSETLVALDAEGRVREISRGAIRRLGRAPTEVEGKDWFEAAIAEDDRAIARDTFTALVEGREGAAEEVAAAIVGRDGAAAKLVWRLDAARDDQGRVSGVLASGRPPVEAATPVETGADLSPPAAQPAPDARFTSFAEAVEEAVWIADAESGRLTYLSPGFTRLYGFTQTDLEADVAPWMEAVASEDRPLLQTAWEAALAGETQDVVFAFTRRGEDAAVKVRDRLFPVRDEGGRVIGVGGAAKAVHVAAPVAEPEAAAAAPVPTETDEALRASEAHYRSLVESAPQLVWTSAKDGGFDYVGPGWVEFTGRGGERLLGQDWIEAVHPEDQPRTALAWGEAVRGEGVFDTDARLVRADGVSRWFRLRARLQRDQAGHAVRWYGTATDVTELVEAKAALEQQAAARAAELERSQIERGKTEAALAHAQRLEAVGRLTGGVAHDFNNLLTVMIGALDIIQRHADKSDRVRRLSEAALTAGRRGEKLTRQLLAFSRRQEFQVETLDLSELIRGSEPLIRRALGEGSTLKVEAPAHLGAARLDPVQFESALMNLIVNARDAVEHGGAVTLRAELVHVSPGEIAELEAGDYVRVAVIDTGVGMTAEVAGRALEPFFTTKEPGRGTGLGLAQVYAFVHQSGGQILIDSTPGEGSTVSLYLPSAEAPAETPVRTAPETHVETQAEPVAKQLEPPADAHTNDQLNGVAAPLRPVEGGKTVLLVDDDAGVREVAESLLTELGCAVVTARDGPQALDMLERSPEVDLLLTDMFMPGGMTGVELAETARQSRPDLKVLLSSGGADEPLEEAASQGWSVLRKPYQAEELSQAVKEALTV